MTSVQKLSFNAHARLKDIVGSGLIMSDNIAIIELIKNSKDANSPSVRIEFTNSGESNEETELRISDRGHGMSMDDIQNKWLNIAYSDKRYRQPKQGAYAGNKGIGRFSCDRLGLELTVFTKKRGGAYIKLDINWQDFEVDEYDKSINTIDITATTFSDEEFSEQTGEKPFKNGTILAIRHLRRYWDEDGLKSLRRELERFIVDPDNKFSVAFLHKGYPRDHEINAPIENKIFQELDFRATSIQAETVKRGTEIHFELRHDGDFVFRSVEKNPYSKLQDIRLNLFFLNQPAKAYFKRKTGYRSVNYGSVFLFLNGFRVFPYGSFGDDWLGVQKRQAQGTRRFFATRDLVGFIQVIDTEGEFSPVSSREGLVRNVAFEQLSSPEKSVNSAIDDEQLYGFFHKAMRKLEKFVVEGLDWDRIDRSIGDDNEEELLAGNYKFLKSEKPVFEMIDSIIRIRSPQDHIEDVEVNLRYLSELAQQEKREYAVFIENLENKFDGTPIKKLKPTERRDLSKFISRQAKELKQKNKTNIKLERKTQKTSQALKAEERRRIFAEFEATADQTRIIQLHHQVALVAGALHKRMSRAFREYRRNSRSFTKEKVLEFFEVAIFDIKKIISVSKLASKADFDISTNRVREDLVQFIKEYLESFKDISHGWGIEITFSNQHAVKLEKLFRPIEITMLIDNLVDNAGKAGAKLLEINVFLEDKAVVLQFDDNGRGLTDRFPSSKLFEKGITTTSGSGIGLSHAKQIVEELRGKIEIFECRPGARVRVEFNK